MKAQVKNEALKTFPFLKGLEDNELTILAKFCKGHTYNAGDICQADGQSTKQINLIIKGKAGVVSNISNFTYTSNEIITDICQDGDVFGWSALLQGTPWSTLRALEPTEVFQINIDELLALCESNHRIGYVLMKNLSSLIASRFRRNRMQILNAIAAIKGE